jgi:O-antigen ligase
LPVIIIAASILSYMAIFLTSSIVKDATKSRLTATEVVIFYVERSPILGYGPGMFIPIFENTKDFIQEYGVALDGHGFIQKVSLENGLVGLVLFVTIMLYIVFFIWRAQHRAQEDRVLYIFLFIMVVGEVIFQSFNTSYFISVLWLPIGVALTAAGFLKPSK